ncbi:DNA-repair protein xrcc1 [Nesidiocoris tenuis]|uniref:DNA-repair protein xrcc1 n=1 Tax=Nesidiocoris tenuis TaxID=355587 RepID=A0ABN7AQ06_9HEMI|nr:DNA-repair protein xrcc1 [Nesidiocoris tenuis]
MSDDDDDIDDFLADSGSEFEPGSESEDDSIASLDDDGQLTPSPAKTQKKTPKTPRNRKDKTGAQAPKRAAPPAKGPSPSKKPKIVAVSAFNARSRPKKPFHQLMADVVFVISGFQNPMRSDLRNAALAMGAKYKADWDNSCTHLVCAFRNTPKFNQVRGRGKIVKKDWIESCYESRKRFPWRRYALDPSDQGQNESEEEIWEDKGPSPTPVDNRKRLNDTESEDEDEVEKEVKRIRKLKEAAKQDKDKPSTSKDNRVRDIALPSTSRSSDGPSCSSSSNMSPIIDEESDKAADKAHETKLHDLYTDVPHIPMFFRDYQFLILDDINEDERAKLKRYILPRLGTIVTDMEQLLSPNLAYCVTENKERFDEVKNDFPNVIGVLPDWIWLCHDENALQDHQPYCL